MQFNPKGQYLLYAGGDRREVYLQDGRFYNIKHELLPSDLKWLDENGYAMNAELRNEVINQMTKAKYQRELDELNTKIANESQRLKDEQAQQLDKHYKQLTQANAPTPKSTVELTSVEKDLYGVKDDSPDPFEGTDEPEAEGQFALVGGGGDPFEGVATPVPPSRKPVKGTVQIRRRKAG